MLDQTLQGLFGLGLKLEYCIELVDESPQQAKDGLEKAIASLSELMQPIRDRIMELK